MADIPAANVTLKKFNITGNSKTWSAKVKGDGSGTTLNVPFAGVFSIVTGNIDDAGGVPAASFSSGVVTYAAALGSNESHWLRIEGY